MTTDELFAAIQENNAARQAHHNAVYSPLPLTPKEQKAYRAEVQRTANALHKSNTRFSALLRRKE